MRLRPLSFSHFIPAAAYRLVSDPATDGAPIHVNQDIQLQTSTQVRAHMLCEECEDLLNKRGEGWVLKNCWRSETEFLLQDAVRASSPFVSGDGVDVYAGDDLPGVRMDQLAHFGVGIFWRAGLRGWRAIGGAALMPLDLGQYQERLRLFLLGEGPFPEHTALQLAVTTSREPVPMMMCSLPSRASHDNMVRSYCFNVLGLTYSLVLGKAMHPATRALCAISGPRRPIYTKAELDKQLLTVSRSLLTKSRPVGRLRKRHTRDDDAKG